MQETDVLIKRELLEQHAAFWFSEGAAYQRQSGVVMPERKTALNGDVLSFQSEGWNACLDEFARLNGAGSHE